MIRQAISCDVCGVDKQQTNHWFIARQYADELRITPYNPRNRSRAGVMHLCGQTCLHKLLDEFLARNLAAHVPMAQSQTPLPASKSGILTDASLTPRVAHPVPHSVTPITAPCIDEYESSARLLPAPEQIPSAISPLPPGSFPTRTAHADAWKREQSRIQSEAHSRSTRRRSIA